MRGDRVVTKAPAPRRLNFETVGSLAAIVIGASALFVAWDQAQIMRAQQHASVTPIVRIHTSYVAQEDRQIIAINASNVGIGPAFIVNAAVTDAAGRAISMEEALGALPEGLMRPTLWTSSPDGLVMEAGSDAPLFLATWPVDESINADVRRYWSAFPDSVRIDACFCSIYERCWTTRLNQKSRPEPARDCVMDQDG